jgi:Zn-dependent peptidase ImmA (M78 family)
MERIQSINPERIAWCCADYGITPGDLASGLNIAVSSIERVMAGEDGMTFGQLRKLAEYFGRGVLFFLESGPVDGSQVHTPQFRTLANQKTTLSTSLKKLIERVEKQRAVYLSLLEDLDETERLRFNPPTLPSKDPPEAARIARAWLGLANENNFETYRAAVEAQGILVFRSNGYNGKWQIPKKDPILGFTLYDSICPVIVVKKQPSEARQSFTLMHELGHALLHKVSSIDDDSDMWSYQGLERDANAFAGHFLVPDTFLTSIHDMDRPGEVSQYDEWLSQPRKAWGVSGEVILRRLQDAGRLQPSQYNAYRQWRASLPIQQADSGTRMYRHREPKHVFGDTFVRTVLDALNARHITLAKASSYLDSLKIKDLHQLENLYAGV